MSSPFMLKSPMSVERWRVASLIRKSHIYTSQASFDGYVDWWGGHWCRWNIPIHVDAASGGFVAPFLYKDLRWDFRLPLVKSINVSGHKYGLVYPGIGWVVWRSKEDLPEELIFHVNYLGADQPTFTLNFSKGLHCGC